ncbi:MAG: hypothetical protein EBU66_14530, partial [Bacteroidetes bacterium]|nr:hypothetical protein [Bacteroidota bacterium]
MDKLKEKLKELQRRFENFNTIGKSQSILQRLIPSFGVNDEMLVKSNYPAFSFYSTALRQWFDEPQPFYNVLEIENLTRISREELTRKVTEVIAQLKYKKIKHGDNFNDVLKKLSVQLKKSPVTNGMQLIESECPVQSGGGLYDTNPEGELKNVSNEGSFYQRKLREFRENINEPKETKKIIDEIEYNPIYNSKNQEIDTRDRIVFIATTFIIRGIVMFLLDWAINTYMIQSFAKAYYFYLFLYTAILLLLVLLINAPSENVSLSIIFYYINTDANNYTRILLHIGILFSLLPIMLVIKKRSDSQNVALSYEQKRDIYRITSNITLFTW